MKIAEYTYCPQCGGKGSVPASVSAPEGPALDAAKLLEDFAAAWDSRYLRIEDPPKMAERLRALATALPGLLEASRELDALSAKVELLKQGWDAEIAARVDDDKRLTESRSRLAALEAALKEIDDIRNSIVGTQTVNWSAHIYPLVAALERAGIHGQGFEQARTEAKTLIDRTIDAEKKHTALRSSYERALAELAKETEDAGNARAELRRSDEALADMVGAHERAVKAIEAIPTIQPLMADMGTVVEAHVPLRAVLAAFSEKADV